MEEARDDSIMAAGEVKSKKEVILAAQRDKNKVLSAALMDICHLKKRGAGAEISEVQRSSRASRRHRKRRLRSIHSIY